MSNTQVLDDPSVEQVDKDETPFHYVNKTSILESVIEGGFVIALCGEIFQVTRSAQDSSNICPRCEEIFNSLPKG